MPKSTDTCNRLLRLAFNGTAWPGIADNAATSPLTGLWLGLYSADPGLGNSQLTNEVAYTNYARIQIARTTAGWQVTANTATNVALAQFPQCGAVGALAKFAAIGTSATGAGTVLYQGPLNSDLAIANLIQPQFSAAGLQVTEV